jgi:hypothetical protein
MHSCGKWDQYDFSLASRRWHDRQNNNMARDLCRNGRRTYPHRHSAAVVGKRVEAPDRQVPPWRICGLGGHLLTRPAIIRAVIVFALALASLAVSYTIVAVSPDPYDHGYERGR